MSDPTLTAHAVKLIKAAERERFARIDAGLIRHKWFRPPCTVRILMLIDADSQAGISYNQFYFGLSEVLDTLRDNPEWWVNFEVTRAHRQTDPNPPTDPSSAAYALYGPHFEDFRFDQSGFDLDEYDQVWLFGWNSTQAESQKGMQRLSDAELEILYRWMDAGGGVFATGDHAQLGAALCSEIPRVRNMRRWTTETPPGSGSQRHDTLVKGHDFVAPGSTVQQGDRYTFDDESDDIPMNIRLKRYLHLATHPLRLVRRPHPVMCGKDGPIDILPDHPHEGEVVVPETLDDVPAFGTYSAPEYPQLAGRPFGPEIIAWARVQDDHTSADFKGRVDPPTPNGEFGAIGAYDGHRARVGRVMVDSTWHHWFDVNLTGRMLFDTDVTGNITSGDSRKERGFNDTTAGRAALARIKNYFRNVAIWLAPRPRQRCMALRCIWGGLRRYPLAEELHAHLPIKLLGTLTQDALLRRMGPCQTRLIIGAIWRERRPFPPRSLALLSPVAAEADEIMLGGVVQCMLEARESGAAAVESKALNDKALEAMAQEGLRRGAAAIEALANEHFDVAREVLDALRGMIGK